jgi:hypothetical protein
MADTKHHAAPPVEGDGIEYSGIVWFLVILVGTVIFCQVLVWGLFELMEYRVVSSEVARSPLAAEPAQPRIEGGRLLVGTESAPAGGAIARPGLLTTEPEVLAEYRRTEDAALGTYGWVNQGAGIVRLPIERAKTLVLERGLPARVVPPTASAPAAPVTPPAAAGTPPAAPTGH